ncbi:MAG: bifunctional folylpolyglutamate synthase/dihydrofolate synthase [Candidatus Roseilinea sp.]|nr:MAG: bifunctional folylpolyglutamate synthase/dihydrofolate synthase [Candidatus Roseilinea sp.]
MDFSSAVAYIHGLDRVGTPQHTHTYAFQHGIARARHLLERLGGAPTATRRCVLIAGSKGKGSTAMMLSAALSAAGYRVGIFTGPHLLSPLERFIVSQHAQPTQMSEAQFATYAAQIARIVSTWDRPALGLPTRFEAFTAMAYHWFEAQGVDIAVMEIGIGGRHDAVNLAEPIVSVITNISLEHTQVLGRTLAEIAYAKAGVLRADGAGVIAPQPEEATRVIWGEARRLGSLERLYFAEACCSVTCAGIHIGATASESGQWLRVQMQDGCADKASAETDGHALLFCPLLGRYQLENAATAITALRALRARDYRVNSADLQQGFASLRWPGRFQVLRRDPLIVADGAHTPYSMSQLCASLQEYFPDRRIHFIIGALRDKDTRGILQEAARVAISLTFTDMNTHRAVSSEQLLATWQALDLSHPPRDAQRGPAVPRVFTASAVASAVRQTLARAARDDVICIAGSLHLAALAIESAKDFA